MVFGTMPSFCALILTEIMAASWILVDIAGVIRPHNVWPRLFFFLLNIIKKKKKKNEKKCIKIERCFDMSTKSQLYYH